MENKRGNKDADAADLKELYGIGDRTGSEQELDDLVNGTGREFNAFVKGKINDSGVNETYNDTGRY